MSSSEVRLRWSGEGLAFSGGGADGKQMVLDSEGEQGPSPMQALLLSLAGCMGVDLCMILQKSRVPLESLEVVVEGERAERPPRYFRSIRLTCLVRGPGEKDQAKLERAVELSRDTYCSVLHTLRPDLHLDIRIQRS